MFWPLVPLHAPQAHADGAGRDNDDSVAIFPEFVGSLNYEGQVGEEGLVSLLIYYGTGSCICVSVSQSWVYCTLYKTQLGISWPGRGQVLTKFDDYPKRLWALHNCHDSSASSPGNEPEEINDERTPWNRNQRRRGGLVPFTPLHYTHIATRRWDPWCDSASTPGGSEGGANYNG